MEYYDPIDHQAKRIAALVTIVLMSAGFFVANTLRFDVHRSEELQPPLEIVFEAETVPEPERNVVQQSAPTDVRRDRATAHEQSAPKEQSVQTSGEAEKTQTVNPNALFRPMTGGDAQTPTGNRLAPDGGREAGRGESTGYNLQGSDQLDAGLQGRGLREGLPTPTASYNVEGTVVVYVTVDSDGNVTSAEVRQQGSTTQEPTLRRLAVEAARKAKFKQSSLLSQGGTITYVFKLK